MKSETRKSKINKHSPILVIGLGSIGTRHYNNLLALGYDNVHVHDVDAKKILKYGSHAVATINTPTLERFSVVFICNPSHLHVSTALLAAKAGCHMFIEKPLALSTKGLSELAQAIKKNQVTAMVACNYRFHQGYAMLVDKLERKILGRPLFAEVAIGYDLSTARVGVDYRKTYAVSRASGGGVLFDSGAHVVDYLTALFGDITAVMASSKTLVLEMNAEDFATAQLEFKNGMRTNIELDYFSQPRRNFLEVQCERGRLRWDVVDNSFSITDATGKVTTKKFTEDTAQQKLRNNMFVLEVKYFIDVVKKKNQPVSDITHAMKVSRVLAAMLQSDKTKTSIPINKNNYR